MYDDLNIFIKLAEMESYSKLSKQLNISQATISRRIQNLENELGLALIKRGCRVFELTEEGRAIFQRMIAPLQEFITELDNYVQGDNIVEGILKLALPAALSFNLINPIITRFNAKYPQVKLLIYYTSNPIDLVKDGYNVALSTLQPVAQTNKIRLLKKFYFKLYATPEYIKTYGQPATLDEIKEHNLMGMILLNGELLNISLATNLKTGEQTQLNHRSTVYINNLVHGIQLAQSSQYIVGGWDELFQEYLANKEFIQILPDYIFGEMPCYLIRHNTASQLEQLFCEFVINEFNLTK